jgi:hypothetical protein
LIFEGTIELCETELFGVDVLWVALPFAKCFLGFELKAGHSHSLNVENLRREARRKKRKSKRAVEPDT